MEAKRLKTERQEQIEEENKVPSSITAVARACACVRTYELPPPPDRTFHNLRTTESVELYAVQKRRLTWFEDLKLRKV